MFAGVLAHLVGVVGELHAAGLAATADLDLGLDDDRVADASAAATASSTVVTASPGDTGMSKLAKNCLPWYSRRSTRALAPVLLVDGLDSPLDGRHDDGGRDRIVRFGEVARAEDRDVVEAALGERRDGVADDGERCPGQA